MKLQAPKVMKPPHAKSPAVKSPHVHTPKGQNLGGTKPKALTAWSRHKQFSF